MFYIFISRLTANHLQVVIGPNFSLPEGTVVSMHHPEQEEEDDDDDEFLSDDADISESKGKNKQKGEY